MLEWTPAGERLHRRAFAAGMAAIALVNLVIGRLDPTQPLPKGFPAPGAVAIVVSLFTLAAAAGMVWRRSAAASAAALAAYYAIVAAGLLNLRPALAEPAVFGAWFGAVEDLALAAAALVVFALLLPAERRAARLARVGRGAFGLCAIYFGLAHFVYPQLTIPLVPGWLPPSRSFWAYATGLGHIAGGIALVVGIVPRPAALLLAAMYASFTPLVHLPLLLADPSKPFFWTENALNLALAGAAWVMAGAAPVEIGQAAAGDPR